MQYTHVVFDIDGTLTDTDYAVLTSLQRLLRARTGETYTFEALQFVKGIPGVEAFRRLGFAPQAYPQLMREWEDGMRALGGTITVFDGAAELLDRLSAAGVRLGIATSKTRDQYEKDFMCYGIARHFPVSITCEDTDAPKPQAGPLTEYMRRTGARPQEMLYVGDSVYDSMTAAAAGVDFALALWGTSDPAIPAKLRPARPADLLDMVL